MQNMRLGINVVSTNSTAMRKFFKGDAAAQNGLAKFMIENSFYRAVPEQRGFLKQVVSQITNPLSIVCQRIKIAANKNGVFLIHERNVSGRKFVGSKVKVEELNVEGLNKALHDSKFAEGGTLEKVAEYKSKHPKVKNPKPANDVNPASASLNHASSTQPVGGRSLDPLEDNFHLVAINSAKKNVAVKSMIIDPLEAPPVSAKSHFIDRPTPLEIW